MDTKDAQALMRRIYYDRDVERGMARTLLRTFQELGELSEVIQRNGSTSEVSDEIADVFEKCGHRVNVRAIVREALRLKSLTGYSPEIRKPEDYVPRVLSMLMNSPRVVSKVQSRGWKIKDYENALRNKILEVLKMIPASKRGGRNPFIFTVSAAYASDRLIAVQYGKRAVLTQKLASTATKVAEYSIRDHFGMMKKVIEVSHASIQ